MLFADTSVQTAFDHALWQYPVAGLLVLVVILFLRDLAKAEQRNQEDRRHIQVTFTDALEREREEMSGALDRLGNRQESISQMFAQTVTDQSKAQREMQTQLIEVLSKFGDRG